MNTMEQSLMASSLGKLEELQTVSASVLKNQFSELTALASKKPVAVTRHHRREFVILSAEQYEALIAQQKSPLASLTEEFDAMVAKMNTPEANAAMDWLFEATGDELGQAAMEAHQEGSAVRKRAGQTRRNLRIQLRRERRIAGRFRNSGFAHQSKLAHAAHHE